GDEDRDDGGRDRDRQRVDQREHLAAVGEQHGVVVAQVEARVREPGPPARAVDRLLAAQGVEEETERRDRPQDRQDDDDQRRDRAAEGRPDGPAGLAPAQHRVHGQLPPFGQRGVEDGWGRRGHPIALCLRSCLMLYATSGTTQRNRMTASAAPRPDWNVTNRSSYICRARTSVLKLPLVTVRTMSKIFSDMIVTVVRTTTRVPRIMGI